MDDKDYTKRETDLLMKSIKDHIDERFDELSTKADRIESQTIKTNGRVTKLEGWKNWIGGGLAFITVVVIPFCLWFISTFNVIKKP